MSGAAQKSPRGRFGSRLGLLLTILGVAVGLGNVMAEWALRAMRRFANIAIICALSATSLAAQGPLTIGEHVKSRFASPHPHPAGNADAARLVWSDRVFHPGAVYIAPHFARFELAPGDRVVVRSPDGAQSWTYTGLGKGGRGLSKRGFFAVHIKGDTAVVELWASNPRPSFGYEIDYYGRGYNVDEIRAFWEAGLGEEMNLPEPPEQGKSICTTNDSEEAKCYQTTEPTMYDRGRAVARMTLNGAVHCTGWLVGFDGHLITNEHCIDAQEQRDDIDFEWSAEGAHCATSCQSPLACPGIIEASGGTLVQLDAGLDYSLVLPDTSVGGGTDLPATYGFLQLRGSGAVLNERMYIIHHPGGWGKQFSVESSYPLEPDPPNASVISLSEAACLPSSSVDEVGYWADTQGGSSGSPVLGYADHRVIALHHCGGSDSCTSGTTPPDDPNRGVPVEALIADLGDNLPCGASCDLPPDTPSGLAATANGDNRIDVAWTASAGADNYNVYRAVGSCPQTGYELIAGGVAGTTYSDTDVSGGTTYAYRVKAFDETEGCESCTLDCADAAATGLCTLGPTFDGLQSVASGGDESCSVDLAWNAATGNCGDGLLYNVWRSTTPGFDPDATAPLATCVGGTTYQDITAVYDTDYFYVVRAEDDSGNGSGVCAGGSQDDNTEELSGVAAGPNTETFADDVEAGSAAWTTAAGAADTGTDPWSVVEDDSHSPTHAWFVSDETVVKDQHLLTAAALSVPAGPSVLEFWHRFDTELRLDGGVLELSTDGGGTWLDILDGNPNRFIEGEYVSNLSGATNPLGDRPAWHGDSSGFVRAQVDLSDFSGQDILLRWRMGCDAGGGGAGWWVDDVRLFFGSACITISIFADGFESGDTSAWTATVP